MKPLLALFAFFLSAWIFAALPLPVLANSSNVLLGSGGDYKIPTKSFLDRRYRSVIRQKYDFSCGSAALASLLTYHYGRTVSEKDVIEKMFAVGDQEKIKTQGFSLLDMKRYLESLGLKSNGFKESLDKLTRVGIPAIVLINHRGYMHFVIVQGVTKDEVLIGDPSLGTRIMDKETFLKQWNSILFVVLDEMPRGRSSFNTAKMWNKSTRSGALSSAMSDLDLARISLNAVKTPGYF